MKLFENIQIQTLQGCNLKCKFCPNSYMPQTMENMTAGVYVKIIDELNALNYKGRIAFYLMNEPLLDDRLEGFINFAKEKLQDVQLMFSTNGTLATKERIEKLLKAGINKIVVSCYTEDVYNKIKNFRFDEVELLKFFERDLNKQFYNRGGNIEVGESKAPLKKYCKYPFEQMYITADGKAVLCCSDYKKEVVFGDVSKEKLVDIWNNEKYNNYRNNLKKLDRANLVLCKKCNY